MDLKELIAKNVNYVNYIKVGRASKKMYVSGKKNIPTTHVKMLTR